MFTDSADVAREVVELHKFFVDWYRGDAASMDRVERALAPDFTMVTPDGELLARPSVIAGITEGRKGSSPGIEVHEIEVRSTDVDHALATYQEWHHHPDGTTVRLSTALFTRDTSAPNGWAWRHVHETWVTPPEAGD